MGGYAPRARGEIVGPRHLGGASGRPRSFKAAEPTATLGFVLGALPGGSNEVGIHIYPR